MWLTMLVRLASWWPLVTAANEPVRSRCWPPSPGDMPLIDMGDAPSTP